MGQTSVLVSNATFFENIYPPLNFPHSHFHAHSDITSLVEILAL